MTQQAGSFLIDNLTNFKKMIKWVILYADVAELADAIDLGSIVNRRAGSIPVIRIFLFGLDDNSIQMLSPKEMNCNK